MAVVTAALSPLIGFGLEPRGSDAAATEVLGAIQDHESTCLITAGAAGFAAQGAKPFGAIGISVAHFPLIKQV
jgi:hypothetical protein